MGTRLILRGARTAFPGWRTNFPILKSVSVERESLWTVSDSGTI